MSIISQTQTLLIDNYDSYTFNLYQLIAAVTGTSPIVVQNDDFDSDWEKLCKILVPGRTFHNIVISPGPGSPVRKRDVGLSMGAAKQTTLPVFGVCLGHQLLAFINGGSVVRAKEPMHGRISEVYHDDTSELFYNIPNPFKVVRYHSLIVEEDSLPSNVNVIARTKCGAVMGISVKTDEHVAWGVQFHPESICTDFGKALVMNFLKISSTHTVSKKTLVDSTATLSRDPPKNTVTVRKVSLFAQQERIELSTETLFENFFKDRKTRFWLDSATRELATNDPAATSSSRFSYMGDATGTFCSLLEFFVEPNYRNFEPSHQHEQHPMIELRESKLSSDGQWEVVNRDATVDVFDYLDIRMKELKASTVYEYESETKSEWDLPFPFACGYVGYFGFGLRRLCGVKSTEAEKVYETSSADPGASRDRDRERVQVCNADSYVPESTFLFADRMIVWDHDSNLCYVVALNSTEQSQMDWVDGTCEKLKELSLAGSLNPAVSASCKATAPSGSRQVLTPNVSNEQYKKDINRCIEHIRAGETYEVCLTKQLHRNCKTLRSKSLKVYKKLRAINPAPYCVYFEVETGNRVDQRSADFAICCSSPERFLRIESNGHVESKPIKGTIRRGGTFEEDQRLAEELRTSVKDRAENLMIVDLVRNDIGRVCSVGSVKVPSLMHIESFSSVHQLVTTVHGKLAPNRTTVNAIRAAFPGGSMTGAPKLRTMNIIDEIEVNERGIYSGALGFLSITGSSDLNIVIRTAVITPEGVSVGTGGAIVALSDDQEELDETILKANKLQTALEEFLV